MNIHHYGVQCILKCNMMVAAFMGIKISLWCIKVYVITSAALK